MTTTQTILTTTFLVFLALLPDARAQSEEKDPIFNFGVQAGAIFPSNLFRVRNRIQESEGITYQIQPDVGVQFGGLATFRLSSRFQLQGGLSLLRRNYNGSATHNGEQVSVKLNTTLYEVPLLITYYQRLGSQLLLSLGTGVNLQTLPSDLGAKDGPQFQVLALRRAFALPASLTVLGLEFRRKNTGGFFAGIAYCITPFTLYDTGFQTRFNGQDRIYAIPHIGDYFSVVVRYYLD
jgi:hypothetical protein